MCKRGHFLKDIFKYVSDTLYENCIHKMERHTIFQLLLCAVFVVKVEPRTWYVSSSGLNDDDCGSLDKPCKHIRTTVEKTTSNDIIMIERGDFSWDCSDYYTTISWNLTLQGHGYEAIIDCHCSKSRYAPVNNTRLLFINGSTDEDTNVHFKVIGLTLRGQISVFTSDQTYAVGFIHGINSFVSFENCIFKESCTHAPLNLQRSTAPGLNSECNFLNFQVTRCILDQAILIALGCEKSMTLVGDTVALNSSLTLYGDTTVSDSFFQGDFITWNDLYEKEVPMGVLAILHEEGDVNLDNVTITEVSFSYGIFVQLNGGSVTFQNVIVLDNIIQDYDIASQPASPFIAVFGLYTTYFDVTVKNCSFFENHLFAETALFQISDSYNVHIEQTVFRNNTAKCGALVQIISTFTNVIDNNFENNIISDCTRDAFTNLLSGMSYFISIPLGGALSISCKEIIDDLFGKGSFVNVEKCIFKNNISPSEGNCINVSGFNRVQLTENRFVFTKAYETKTESVRRKTSIVAYRNLPFDKNCITIEGMEVDLQYVAEQIYYNVMQFNTPIVLQNVTLTCPTGFQLQNRNTTTISTNPFIHCDGSSKGYLTASVSCIACGDKTYSIQRGSSYIADMRSSIQNPQCNKCPQGGTCKNGVLTSRPNYWGNVYRDEVFMTLCPPGYCCASQDCPSLNECNPHRTGILCGTCKNGTSESLFSTGECIMNTVCNGGIWMILVGYSLGYAMFFFLKKKASVYIMNQVHFIKELKKRYFSKQPDGEIENQPQKQISLTAVINILSYFYQVEIFLYTPVIDTYASEKEKISSTFYRLFNLQPIFELLHPICPVPYLNAVGKILFWGSPGFLIPLMICILYGSAYIFLKCKYRKNTEIFTSKLKGLKKVSCSIFMLALFLTYNVTLKAALDLVHCVSIGDKHVLFKDGTIECFKPWQTVVVVYLAVCGFPLFLQLIFGVALLEKKIITLSGFFLGVLLPAPCLIFWGILRLLKRLQPRSETSNSELSEAVVDMLEEPFVDGQGNEIGWTRFWTAALILRRLIITLTFTFLDQFPILRASFLSFFSIIFLIWHAYPYKNKTARQLESISLFILCCFSIMNCIQATFYASAFTPNPGDMDWYILNSFDWIHVVFIVLVPLFILCIVFMLLIVTVVRMAVTMYTW